MIAADEASAPRIGLHRLDECTQVVERQPLGSAFFSFPKASSATLASWGYHSELICD